MADRQQQPEPSLAEDLGAAYDAAELDGMGDALAEALGGDDQDGGEDDVDPRAAPEGDDKTADPAADGKAETAEDGAAAQAAGDDTAAGDQARPAAVAPDHWNAEDKAFLAGLPDDATRERVIAWRKGIERGAGEKFEAAAAARREIGELEQALRPLAPEIQAAGGDRMQVMRGLIDFGAKLRGDPAAAIVELARNYGRLVGAGTGQAQTLVRQLQTALGGVGDGASQQGGQAASQDPTTARLTALEARIAREDREREHAARQQQEDLVRRSESAIAAFAGETGSDGQPAHPHFEAVRPMMGALMQAAIAAGKPLSLQEAYKQAVWASPELRDDLIRAHTAADARLAAERDQAALARARQAATPRTASAPVEEPDTDLPVKELLGRELDRAERRRV